MNIKSRGPCSVLQMSSPQRVMQTLEEGMEVTLKQAHRKCKYWSFWVHLCGSFFLSENIAEATERDNLNVVWFGKLLWTGILMHSLEILNRPLFLNTKLVATVPTSLFYIMSIIHCSPKELSSIWQCRNWAPGWNPPHWFYPGACAPQSTKCSGLQFTPSMGPSWLQWENSSLPLRPAQVELPTGLLQERGAVPQLQPAEVFCLVSHHIYFFFLVAFLSH